LEYVNKGKIVMKKNLSTQTLREGEEIHGAGSSPVSRRKFLKLGTSAGVTAAALGRSALLEAHDAPQPNHLSLDKIFPAREHENFPVLITDACKRMDHKNTVFIRQMWDESLVDDLRQSGTGKNEQKKEPQPGWTQLDQALDEAAWSVNGAMADGSPFGVPQSQAYEWEGEISRQRYVFNNPRDAAKKIKKAARFLGADLVGITKHDSLWDYSRLVKPKFYDEDEDEAAGQESASTPETAPNKRESDEPAFNNMFRTIEPDFPFKPKSVIVFAFEMDYKAISASPSAIEGAATGLGYSRMAATGYSMANFIRGLGYKAFACGNDVSLSTPYAIAAGLGELGRNGLLVTREYGPRVRLAKVYTELDLAVDKPKTFGVWEFCKSCKRCADQCPSGAVSHEEPSLAGQTISNNPGVLKWYINPEKCYAFWGENDSDCTNCITSCPFNKPAMWHHQLISAAAIIPGAPLHSVMAKMDKVFGFGNTGDKKANLDFWKED